MFKKDSFNADMQWVYEPSMEDFYLLSHTASDLIEFC